MASSTTPSTDPASSLLNRVPVLLRAVHARAGALARVRQHLPRSGRRSAWLAIGLAAAGAIALWTWLGTTTGQRGTPDEPEVSNQLAWHRGASRFGDRPGSLVLGPREAGGQSGTAPWARRILRRATLSVQVTDVDDAIARLTDLIEATGGYVADTQTRTDEAGTTRASITAYVPSGQFGSSLAELEGLGRITTRRISGQDVSEEFVDLEARVRNLERHETQLLSFMGKARKVADLLTLEKELARVRGEIERLTGRLRFLTARTEMAAIQLSLLRLPSIAARGGGVARAWERVRGAFLEGWDLAFRVAVGLAALVAQLSPLMIPSMAAWALYRRRARREPVAPPPVPAGGQ